MSKQRSTIFQSQVYLIGTLLLALVLRLTASTQSFWLDESAQAIMSKNPFATGHFNGDFQPPLTYYLAHFWMKFGSLFNVQSEWFLRLPNIIISVATVYLLYKLIRALSDAKTGILAGLLLATAPFHIYYAHEFRMYALLTFLSVSSWYALYSKKWTTLALITCLGVFTHYFMFVHIAAQGIYSLIFDRPSFKKFTRITLLGISPFIFWIPTFMIQLETSRQLLQAWPGWAQVSNAGFMRFPGLVLAKFTVGMISPEPRWLYGLSVAITGGIVAWVLWIFIAKMRTAKTPSAPAILTLVMWILPLSIAWIGGIFISASSPWRIQFALPGLYGSVAYAHWISRSFKPYIHRIMTVFACILLIQNLIWTSQYLLNETFQREDWRGAVAYTDERALDSQAIVLSEFTGPWAPMAWYSQSFQAYRGGSTEQRMNPESVQTALADVNSDNIILYTYLFELSDPDHLVEAELTRKGYMLTSQKDFRGVGIINTYTLSR